MTCARSSGVLLHISSLPGKYGIGDFGKAAFDFVDALAEAGQTLWQILPLGPTGYGDSPYSSFSSFAGNELFIDPLALFNEALISQSDLDSLVSLSADKVDFGRLIEAKRPILKKAARRFLQDQSNSKKYVHFVTRHKKWLSDYAIYRSIKNHYDEMAARNGVSSSTWNSYWPIELRNAERKAVAEWEKGNSDEIEAVQVQQYFFYNQWNKLKDYANGKGIRIVGDLPIFTALDSADVWSRPELFDLDSAKIPRKVSGVPPDYFSEDGQLWGNPVYRWSAHRKEKFAWWTERLRYSLGVYDMVRIDHFRGFEAYWAVPGKALTARIGTWEKAPGHELFRVLKKRLGTNLPIIAEDLGFITDGVRDLRDSYGFPGMKILQFAFDSRESGDALSPDNVFFPHNYPENCVVYTGTHDNDTLVGKFKKAAVEDIAFLEEYLGYRPPHICQALVREALKSSARIAIVQIQDILELDSDSRMNTPSTVGGNWTWRLQEGQFDSAQRLWLKNLSRMYARNI